MSDEEGRHPRESVVRRERFGRSLADERSDLTLVRIINFLLRHRWKLLLVSASSAVLAVGISVLLPATYTSNASLMPQVESGLSGQLSQLSGVASQFGVSVPTGSPGQSPQFYADLLESRRLLEEAVTTPYRVDGRPGEVGSGSVKNSADRDRGDRSGPKSVTLVELYDVEGKSQGIRVYHATERLEETISVSSNPETGVVSLSVTTEWPAVSQQVVSRLIQLVNEFNNRVRQSQASEQVDFVTERLQEARQELRAAEDSLERFLQNNVSWQQSPELRFQQQRLQRQVDLKQQKYTSLAVQYEEARIAEVKSTPVITTVVEPKAPVKPDSVSLSLKALLGLLVGGFLGTGWALTGEFIKRARSEPEDQYRELLSLSREVASDLRKASRRAKGLLTHEDS